MKNKFLIFSLSLILALSIFGFVPVKADINDYNTVIAYWRDNYDAYAYLVAFYDTPSLGWDSRYNNWRITGSFAGYQQPPQNYTSIQACIDAYNYYYPDNYFTYSGIADGFGWAPNSEHIQICVIKGSINNMQDLPSVQIIEYTPPTPPEPPEPEPGNSWLGDMWEWFLWILGLNDDYSGDIDAYITGGDRERMEMVTPSPTPSPTPVPSPTPYSLDIIDNNGNPVYTITGIPGSTYNINNTTNNNDGSDFDIFEVDLKIGDGGSTNPRDGLNDVMDTSLTYLSDPENVNMQPVGDSFSIIPIDWFLILGVVACFPFIAGFISKLLK